MYDVEIIKREKINIQVKADNRKQAKLMVNDLLNKININKLKNMDKKENYIIRVLSKN